MLLCNLLCPWMSLQECFLYNPKISGWGQNRPVTVSCPSLNTFLWYGADSAPNPVWMHPMTWSSGRKSGAREQGSGLCPLSLEWHPSPLSISESWLPYWIGIIQRSDILHLGEVLQLATHNTKSCWSQDYPVKHWNHLQRSDHEVPCGRPTQSLAVCPS